MFFNYLQINHLPDLKQSKPTPWKHELQECKQRKTTGKEMYADANCPPFYADQGPFQNSWSSPL